MIYAQIVACSLCYFVFEVKMSHTIYHTQRCIVDSCRCYGTV